MGLLDEAIREHLELKRRRGANPTEIERLEREALGPVRRAPQEVREAVLENDPDATAIYQPEEVGEWSEAEEDWSEVEDDESVFDHTAEPDSAFEARPQDGELGGVGDEPEREPPRRTYASPRHHEIAEEWEAHQRSSAGDAGFDPEGGVSAEPPPPAAAVPSPAPEPQVPPATAPEPSAVPDEAEPHRFEQETAEYDVESEHAEEGTPAHPEADDMLEETPEFLQDTPDHDRLWFEQRPPRDFDIEG